MTEPKHMAIKFGTVEWQTKEIQNTIFFDVITIWFLSLHMLINKAILLRISIEICIKINGGQL